MAKSADELIVMSEFLQQATRGIAR
jgi:hypothetical protein